jgi:taurine dioxygenase
MSQLDYDVQPLSPSVGARISGLDLKALEHEEDIAAIRALWLRHGMLVFSRQQLSPAQLVQVAHRFGEIGEYPFVRGMADQPEIVEVIKLPEEEHNFGGLWHTDTSYLAQPPLGSLLQAVELPELGGDTLFASCYEAYETLSEGLREFLAPLRAISSAGKPDAAVTRVDRSRDNPRDASNVVTTAAHPVVRTHPETGRRSLYLSPGHTTHFEGFSVAESEPLLRYLFRHQVRPEFTCRLRWMQGDVALWDNRCTLHNALNDYHGHRRVMRRISLKGETPS